MTTFTRAEIDTLFKIYRSHTGFIRKNFKKEPHLKALKEVLDNTPPGASFGPQELMRPFLDMDIQFDHAHGYVMAIYLLNRIFGFSEPNLPLGENLPIWLSIKKIATEVNPALYQKPIEEWVHDSPEMKHYHALLKEYSRRLNFDFMYTYLLLLILKHIPQNHPDFASNALQKAYELHQLKLKKPIFLKDLLQYIHGYASAHHLKIDLVNGESKNPALSQHLPRKVELTYIPEAEAQDADSSSGDMRIPVMTEYAANDAKVACSFFIPNPVPNQNPRDLDEEKTKKQRPAEKPPIQASSFQQKVEDFLMQIIHRFHNKTPQAELHPAELAAPKAQEAVSASVEQAPRPSEIEPHFSPEPA